MALDRLADLKRGGSDYFNSSTEHEGKPSDARDVEIGTAFDGMNTKTDPKMSAFWNRVKINQDKLRRINNNLQQQQEIRQNFQRCTLSKQENDLIAEFNALDKKNSTMFKEVSTSIKELDMEIKMARNNQEEPQSIRIMEGQLSSLTSEMKETLEKTQGMDLDFQNSTKKKIKRQLITINDGSLTKEEIEDAVNNQDIQALNQMTKQKLFGKASMRLEYAARDIDEKCRGIEQLADNVRKLYDMIKEISEVINAQGEQVNLIADNINQAHNYVMKGNKELRKAKENHEASRKKQCCIILIGVGILGIFAVTVLGLIT